MPAVRTESARKQLTLLACIIGSGIVLLDGTAVNVALPSIQRALGGGLAAQQWVVNGYLLTLGSLILIGGSLGDLYGERRIFAIGVAGFGVASLGCALAPTIGALVAARALQGVAGALLVPSSLAMIVATFAESERGPAIGSWTAWGGIATVLGPLAGGELLAIGSWRWIFLLNLPFTIVCVALILLVIPRAERPVAAVATGRVACGEGGGGGGQPRPDRPPHRPARRALCALGLGGPVFALIEQPRLGWSSPAVLVPLIAGVALLLAFVAYESRARDPMLPLGLFRRRNFSAGNIETLAMYAGLAVLFFFLVLFLQQVGGYTPLQSGLATLPVTLVMFAPLTPLRRARRPLRPAPVHGPRAARGGGRAAAVPARRRPRGLRRRRAAGAAGVLAGLSMTVAPLTAAVLAGAERSQAGIASAVNNAVARVAGLLGTAAVGAAIATAFAASLDSHLTGVPLGTGCEQGRRAKPSACRSGCPMFTDCPRARPTPSTSAAEAASLHSFHLGLAIAGCARRAGRHRGVIGVRNPRRVVRAADCEGGALVGAAGGRWLRTAP